jgi:hypothetical protein
VLTSLEIALAEAKRHDIPQLCLAAYAPAHALRPFRAYQAS